MPTRFLFASGLFAASLAVGLASADDWPQFRGPNGSATSPDSKLPTEWAADKNVAWKVKLPGYAWSCPVVWGDKVFVTTAVSDKQTKPSGGFGGGPGGGFGGPKGGGKGGFGGPGGGMGGGSRPLYAVKAGASGDITPKAGAKSTDAIAWHLPSAGPATPSPLLYEGLLYVLEDRGGTISCYDAKTGKQHYKERIPNARGFTSSPWAYGGKVFCLDDGGTTHVLKAGDDFEVVGANKLGEMAWSSPAVANGAVYLRTVDHLYCIRDGGK